MNSGWLNTQVSQDTAAEDLRGKFYSSFSAVVKGNYYFK